MADTQSALGGTGCQLSSLGLDAFTGGGEEKQVHAAASAGMRGAEPHGHPCC